jgi:NADPH2:quinone reductase
VSTTVRRFVLADHGGPEVLRLETAPAPEPGHGEVVVAVEVAGVNFGDTMIRRGTYLREQPLSMSPGCEAVGRVVDAGPGVDAERGTRVAAFVEAGGAYADRVVVPGASVYPVPEDLPAAAIAAVFLQGTTAHWAVHRYGRTGRGETVLVHAAAGGVGGIAVQLAKLSGASVIATASSATKREAALALGADHALDSSRPEELSEAVRERTAGAGADVVVDGVGGALFQPSLQALALNGRYVIVGSASQEATPFDARRLLPRGQFVCGVMLARVVEADAAEPARTLTVLCDLVRSGELSPAVETLPLERAAEAHRRLDERRVTGKIVLAAAGGNGGS